MRIRVGRLRHRLQLQQPVETRDDYGGAVKSFTTVATVWGAIEPLSGKEYLAIAQTQNEATVRLIIRYRSSIDESWRVISGGKAYSIQSIINHDERDVYLTLMCSEGVAETDITDDSDYVVNSGVYVVNSGTQVVHTS